MTQDEIIRMAREAGVFTPEGHCVTVSIDIAERFATLVAAHEREACLACYSPDDTATDWADKIKARGEK